VERRDRKTFSKGENWADTAKYGDEWPAMNEACIQPWNSTDRPMIMYTCILARRLSLGSLLE